MTENEKIRDAYTDVKSAEMKSKFMEYHILIQIHVHVCRECQWFHMTESEKIKDADTDVKSSEITSDFTEYHILILI